MGDTLGSWARIVVQIVVVISLFGTNVAQVVASSSDAYYLHAPGDAHTLDKRCGTAARPAAGHVLDGSRASVEPK